jgi:hypothetical protein
MTCFQFEQVGFSPGPLSTASLMRFLEGEGQEGQEDQNLTQMVDHFEFKESRVTTHGTPPGIGTLHRLKTVGAECHAGHRPQAGDRGWIRYHETRDTRDQAACIEPLSESRLQANNHELQDFAFADGAHSDGALNDSFKQPAMASSVHAGDTGDLQH